MIIMIINSIMVIICAGITDRGINYLQYCFYINFENVKDKIKRVVRFYLNLSASKAHCVAITWT